MAKYAVYYAYNVSYTGYVEADSEQEALEKHYAQNYIKPPKEGDWELRDDHDIEEVTEEID